MGYNLAQTPIVENAILGNQTSQGFIDNAGCVLNEEIGKMGRLDFFSKRLNLTKVHNGLGRCLKNERERRHRPGCSGSSLWGDIACVQSDHKIMRAESG